METFTVLKKLTENPHYKEQRQKRLASLSNAIKGLASIFSNKLRGLVRLIRVLFDDCTFCENLYLSFLP